MLSFVTMSPCLRRLVIKERERIINCGQGRMCVMVEVAIGNYNKPKD